MDLADLVKTMGDYGLDEGEAVVYFHISRTGGARAAEVADAAKRKRPDTYRILNALVMKGFIEKTLERPTRFIPIPVATALERLVAARREQADQLARNSQALIDAWPKAHADAGPGQQRFTVYQGRDQVQGLLRRMFAAAEDELTVVASPGGLANLGLAAFFSAMEGEAGREVHIRVLTKPDAARVESVAALRGIANVRHAELPSYHQMVIVDANQIALFVSSGRKVSTKGDVQTVLWLNTPDFVLAQKSLFDEVWSTAVSTEERAAAAVEGRLPKETRLLRGRWQRLDRMRRMIGRADRTVWVCAPAAEVARWRVGGLGRVIAKKAAEGVAVMVWTDAPDALTGATIVKVPEPTTMECLVDGAQSLVVAGAREEPQAVAYEGEWAVWSTHPDSVAAAESRFETMPAPRLQVNQATDTVAG